MRILSTTLLAAISLFSWDYSLATNSCAEIANAKSRQVCLDKDRNRERLALLEKQKEQTRRETLALKEKQRAEKERLRREQLESKAKQRVETERLRKEQAAIKQQANEREAKLRDPTGSIAACNEKCTTTASAEIDKCRTRQVQRSKTTVTNLGKGQQKFVTEYFLGPPNNVEVAACSDNATSASKRCHKRCGRG